MKLNASLLRLGLSRKGNQQDAPERTNARMLLVQRQQRGRNDNDNNTYEQEQKQKLSIPCFTA